MSMAKGTLRFVHKYATYKIIIKADYDVMIFYQRSVKVKTYADELLKLLCKGFYTDNTLKYLFVNGFKKEIRNNVRYYLSKHSVVTFHDPVTFMSSIQSI